MCFSYFFYNMRTNLPLEVYRMDQNLYQALVLIRGDIHVKKHVDQAIRNAGVHVNAKDDG